MNQVYMGRKCLITGGLGFLGSNMAIRLAELGAEVTVVDAMIPEYGGNLFNIEPVKDRVRVNFGDICDRHAMEWLARDQDFVFHLAGQVSHVMSLTNPYPDIEYNIKGTVVVLEALKTVNPKARMLFTGTRGQYGPTVKLPVAEDAPTNPKAMHEISKLTAEQTILFYHHTHGIRSVLLRLTNVYGPRAQMKHSQYVVANWFVRLALENKTIPVFGDGKILRDFLYVDDCVEAMLMAMACEDAMGEVFNVGVDKPNTFLELAQVLVEEAGCGRWEFAPFSKERKAQEPGDFYSDISKIKRIVGWSPRTDLREGLRKTIAYYRQHRERYWT